MQSGGDKLVVIYEYFTLLELLVVLLNFVWSSIILQAYVSIIQFMAKCAHFQLVSISELCTSGGVRNGKGSSLKSVAHDYIAGAIKLVDHGVKSTENSTGHIAVKL